MKIQQQLFNHDPDNGVYGDCYRTCVAVILDRDAADVPHVGEQACHADEDGRGMTRRMREWLAQFGLGIAQFVVDARTAPAIEDVLKLSADNPGVPVMILGEAKECPGIGHIVVALDGEIVCDPSGGGLAGPIEGHWWIELVCAINGSCVNGRTHNESKKEVAG